MNNKAPLFQRWRTKIQNDQLASQVSAILLQRHNWPQLLQSLDLSSKLNSPLFLHILRSIKSDPHVALRFFHWAKSRLGFEPDLKPASHLVKISLESGLSQPADPLLDRLVQNYPPPVLADSVVEACEGSDSQSLCLSFVLESYGKKGLLREGLQVFDKMRLMGFCPSVTSCNELLDVMQRENETRLAWCFYGSMLRVGVSPNSYTWSLISRVLTKSGKPDRVARIVEMGFYSLEIYEKVVDYLSKNGEFGAAFDRVQEMLDRKLDPGFTTFSSILNGACKHENPEMIERVTNIMVENKLISKHPLREYDSLIEKLCGMGHSYAAELFFKKALEEDRASLKGTTYGIMLKAMSLEQRRERAIWVFRLMSEKGFELSDDSCKAFSNLVLGEERGEDTSELMMEIVRSGSSLLAPAISEFLSVLCRERKWNEAGEMLNLVLEKGLLPDSISCRSLVEHYCSHGLLDSAMALHDKMERSDLRLDVATYNVLITGLVAEDKNRVEEAVRVFDHMRRHESLSSDAFVALIHGLSRVGQLRKAMRLHDEMLTLGLKPDKPAYKKLILVFK